MFHYAKQDDILSWSWGPISALHFPSRLAIEAVTFLQTRNGERKRALDVGCAVGRTSFELSHSFSHVVGIDYSHAFVRACETLLHGETLPFDRYDEGEIVKRLYAKADASKNCEIVFQQGDACHLNPELGKFDCVVAANLIDRLPEPKLFLQGIKDFVEPGGLLLLTSPFTWMEQFTPKKNWLGGYAADAPKTFDVVCQILLPDFDLVQTKDMPFFIREHARKNQWSVAHASFFIRKQN